jgi:glycosyltransferase involved in cell wall biosynthesis
MISKPAVSITERVTGENFVMHPRYDRKIRVLCVIPTKLRPVTTVPMIFARRQVVALLYAGLQVESFYLLLEPSPRVLLGEWRRLRKAIRAFNPDVIHAQYGTLTALLSVMSSGLPAVVTFRGSDLNPDSVDGRGLSFARRAISELAALRANQIICVSSQLKNRLWWGRNRTVVIPTGVDTVQFRPRSRAEARKQLGWKDDHERVVLFNVSGNPGIKRLDVAQAAIDVAREIYGEIRFVVLEGDVSPDSIPLYMAAADLLLLTSDSEGSPTIVQEAIACELPVVSVDVGDVRERLQGVQPSFIVPRDPKEIGHIIAQVLANRPRSNGAARITECSNEVVIERTIIAYRAAIQNALDD